ncbi:uncharacterized protein SPSK_02051 [Sporothrix schenckii 1099-18]|uniref:Uncharacterized protein n=1 Tax=Sporothrix schenckii 1099-18 TaxID=1397361 RepID=A0A0F2MF41_SPOSC|nr:uncharacterized protein SPSK_02051 [Sporothrix schenckii 1099-18]KJR87440.1 hypothetical protein SPSK_02051 [Sporothrix schenckii 1099-18]
MAAFQHLACAFNYAVGSGIERMSVAAARLTTFWSLRGFKSIVIVDGSQWLGRRNTETCWKFQHKWHVHRLRVDAEKRPQRNDSSVECHSRKLPC